MRYIFFRIYIRRIFGPKSVYLGLNKNVPSALKSFRIVSRVGSSRGQIRKVHLYFPRYLFVNLLSLFVRIQIQQYRTIFIQRLIYLYLNKVFIILNKNRNDASIERKSPKIFKNTKQVNESPFIGYFIYYLYLFLIIFYCFIYNLLLIL